MNNIIFTKDHKSLISRLKKARLDAGLSQKQVADKLGKTQSYFSKLESNQRRLDVVQLQKIAKIYKKHLNYFLSI